MREEREKQRKYTEVTLIVGADQKETSGFNNTSLNELFRTIRVS